MSRDPGQVHPPAAVLDDEQHIQVTEEHGFNVEEVGRQDGRGLGLQERPPGERTVQAPGRCLRP
jgi:hypothetical protein